MRRRLIIFVASIALLVSISPKCRVAPSWSTTGTPVEPSGLTSWKDPGSSSTICDSSATYAITGVDRDFTLTAPAIGTLAAASGETLTTTFKLTADTYFFFQDGVENTSANQAQGLNTFVSPGSFLVPGVLVRNSSMDTRVNLTVTSRGRNAEDFGSDSDSTQAPNAGSYTTDVVLRLTY